MKFDILLRNWMFKFVQALISSIKIIFQGMKKPIIIYLIKFICFSIKQNINQQFYYQFIIKANKTMIHKNLQHYDEDIKKSQYHDNNEHQPDKILWNPSTVKRVSKTNNNIGVSPNKYQKSTLNQTQRISFRKNHDLCHCSQVYQSQIRILEKYLKTANKIDKNTVLYIFGLHPHHETISLQDQSLMLKQLSEKIKKLLEQNSFLKRQVIQLKANNKQALANERYKKQEIIIEIEKTKIEVIEKLIAENQELRQKMKNLEKQYINRSQQRQMASKKWKEALDQLKKQLQSQLHQFYESIQAQNNNLTTCMDNFQHRVIQNQLNVKNILNIIEKKKSQQLQKIDKQPKSQPQTQVEDKSFKQDINQYNSTYFINNDKKNKNSTVWKNINKYASHHAEADKEQVIKILQNKNERLLKEMQILTNKLAQMQDVLHIKIEKILLLENQLHVLKSHQSASKREVLISQNLSDQIVKIRQLLLSCNPSNFEMLQKQFQEILQQRNQMNQKLIIFKQIISKKGKHKTKQQNNGNDNKKIVFLQEKLKRMEEQIVFLKNRNIELEKELEKVKGFQDSFSFDVIQQINKMIQIKVPDGYSGLQWQIIVEKCIEETSNRLKILSQSLNRQK